MYFRSTTAVRLTGAALVSAGIIFACGGPEERNFDEDPSDVSDDGNDPDGQGGASMTDDDPSGGSSSVDGGGGMGGSSLTDVDGEPPNPGCEPPDSVGALTLQSGFPEPGRAAAGAHVEFDFSGLNSLCSVLECRLTHGADAPGDWEECPTIDNKTHIGPFTDAQSQDEAANGVYEIEVRERFDGAAGPVWNRQIYVHNSLHDAQRCPDLPVGDAGLFREATTMFEGASTGSKGSTSAEIKGARVANPFIQFDFDPPDYGSYTVHSADGQVEYLSLRRVFKRNPSGTLVLVRRAYESRRLANAGQSGVCRVTKMRNMRGWKARLDADPCDALVMNSQGFGLCLGVTEEGVTKVYGNNPNDSNGGSALLGAASEYFDGVDHFMWSKLFGSTRPATGEHRYFSPKCHTDAGSCGPYELFLPHRDVLLP